MEMDEPELRSLIGTAAVERRRTASPGAFVRGWRIDTSSVLVDPRACGAAAALIRDLVEPLRPDAVVGIDRAGIPLAQAVASTLGLDHISASSLATSNGVCPHCRVVIVDDIINSGRTARRTIRCLRRYDVEPLAAVCLVKYARRRPILLQASMVPVLSLYSLADLGLHRCDLRLR